MLGREDGTDAQRRGKFVPGVQILVEGGLMVSCLWVK